MKLSVIMPVYNSEKYLNDTMNCIFAQTFSNFELIMVDDGSTDNSAKMCDEYQIKDKRIKVIHQANTGCGGARNTGLCIADGEYICFIDSDDIIHPQMFDIMMNKAAKENADIVMTVEKKCSEDDQIVFGEYDALSISHTKLDCDFIYRRMFSNATINSPYISPCNKIYKKELINNIIFPLSGSEEISFNSKVFGRTNRFILLDENVTLYYYIQRRSSITHDSERALLFHASVLDTYFQIAFEMNKTFPAFSHYAVEKAMKVVLSSRYNMNKTIYRDKINNEIKENIKQLKKLLIKDKRILLKQKMVLLIFYYLPCAYSAFRHWEDRNAFSR